MSPESWVERGIYSAFHRRKLSDYTSNGSFKLPESERFWQNGKRDFTAIVRLNQFRDVSIPPGKNRVLPAAVPVFLGWGRGEKEQPICVAENSHADFILTHAFGQLRPKLIVRKFILLVRSLP
jgi:hypothetical protein